MAKQALRLLCLGALLLGIAASSDLQARSSLLLWSNAGLVGDGHGPKVMYQVLAGVQDATVRAVMGLVSSGQSASELLHASEAGAASTTTIIFAGSQLGAEELRRGGASRLDLVLGSAASSLVVPHASGQACPRDLQHRLEGAGMRVKSIGCHGASDDLVREVSDALASAEQPQVLVVCPAPADKALTKQAALDQELDQLLSVHEAVDASGVRHAFIYASHKAGSTQQRRQLAEVQVPAMKGFGQYTICGQLCVTQTRWLEGMLALLFMALASCAGMTCLNVLNTPTRFETAKEGSTQ